MRILVVAQLAGIPEVGWNHRSLSIAPKWKLLMRLMLSLVATIFAAGVACAAGGELTLKVEEESDLSATITRAEIWRGQPGGKLMPIRRVVPAGVGVVLDRNVKLALPDGSYSFRMTRGPEYRIVTGTFALEDTSSDTHAVQLPRMIDMLSKGWVSGDCLVVASQESLPLRMASEDLHMATTLGHVPAKPVPYRDSDDPIKNDPAWVETGAAHFDGLAFYGEGTFNDKDLIPVQRMIAAKKDASVRVAIENPFAWPLPVWLASQRVDGMFLLGDWLRLDRKVLTVKNGRRPGTSFGGGQAVGLWAEDIYRHVLDAGIQMPPLAGGGSDSARTPVGYNRLYVGKPSNEYQESNLDTEPVGSAQEWWQAAWSGHSVATNGPLMRPALDGFLPGHVFDATAGDSLELQPELSLSTRDAVEYIEVVHNNRVHYSGRLKDFAKAKGVIPKITVEKSGWVIIRVVTLHEDHLRAAISAPWYIRFDDQPRVGKESVEFFQSWLSDYEARLKRLPPEELKKHVPFIQAARKFWAQKQSVAVK